MVCHISTACVLCSALQHGRDCSPLQRWGPGLNSCATNQKTYAQVGHSYRNITDSALLTPPVTPEHSEFSTVTKAKARCIISDQFFALLLLRLCQISRLLSPQTCTRKEHKHIVHVFTGESSPSTQPYRRMRQLLSVYFSCKLVLPLHSA